MVCILAKGSGDCDITRIPWPSASAAFAELPAHYPRRLRSRPTHRRQWYPLRRPQGGGHQRHKLRIV